MKKLKVAFLLLMFATIACTSDYVVMKAKFGDIKFNHKVHSTTMECALCHGDGTPAKIAMDKDTAHTLCINCHTKKSGPTECKECHQRNIGSVEKKALHQAKLGALSIAHINIS